jgi:hypothetical protein
MDRRGRGMSCPYIFTPDDCPDGTKYCITNKEWGKARYSARGIAAKKDGIEISATNMQKVLWTTPSIFKLLSLGQQL